jgi:hypothetical protein
LLEQLVASLPPPLRSAVESQFDAYNLVQREVDGRALNFYRKKGRKANNMEGLPVGAWGSTTRIKGVAPSVGSPILTTATCGSG